MNRKILAVAALYIPLAANALGVDWSAFGTAGYARSDQPYRYQRWIDGNGTLMRDSVIVGQVDVRFNQAWGAAIQGRIAPSDHHDSAVESAVSWAFVSWRPMDDILVRLGKLRLPLMLNTENQDVGVTYDFARLPIEVYSIIPTSEFTGVSATKSWQLPDVELSAEIYSGRAVNYTRYYGREVRDDSISSGAWFERLTVRSTGVVFTAKGMDNVFRAGLHEAVVSRPGGIISDIPYREIVPGVGYYDVSNGPPADRIRIPVQSLGASVMLPGRINLMSEYARMKVNSASSGMGRWGAYIALSKHLGAWTPYVSYAKTRSENSALEKYRAINGNVSPLFSSQLNNYQKLNADIVSPYDQWTGAIGASYRLTTRSLLKAEWAHTRTGIVSSFVDAPSGGNSADQRINVFSLSYSFSF